MNTLDKDFRTGLLAQGNPPCLSLYQPTHRHHPDNMQDVIRFKNLMTTLEKSLLQQFPQAKVQSLLEPFRSLSKDRKFWTQTLDGLAVLGAEGLFRVYKLQQPMPELAVVADSFHTKPLMRTLQSIERYQMLGLNRHEVKLFLGSRDALDEVELAPGVPRTMTEALGGELTEPHLTVASYGGVGSEKSAMHHGHGGKKAEVDKDAERFFRAVDRAITEHHSQPSRLPLMLAALPEHHHMFHGVSHNPFLIKDSIDVHPDALSSKDELRKRAWKLIEPRFQKRLSTVIEAFGSSRSKGLGAGDLAEVARAVANGRVATLLIEDRREMPGRIDVTTGKIEFKDLSNPQVDDVFDDLAELALEKGGEVLVVSAEEMPTQTGVAAIFRS